MSRVGSDSDRICNFLSLNLIDFAADVLMITMTSVILLSIEWKLALVALVPFPFIVLLVHLVRQRLRRGFRQSGIAWAEMTSVLADTIPGIRVVKAFAQEEREVERFERANARVLATNDRVLAVPIDPNWRVILAHQFPLIDAEHCTQGIEIAKTRD